MGSYPISTDALESSPGGGAFNVHELFYDPDDNIIYDSCGQRMYNVFEYVTPNDLFMFKFNKQSTTVWTRSGDLVALVFRDAEYEYNYGYDNAEFWGDSDEYK